MLKDMFCDGAYFSDDFIAMVKKLQAEYGHDARNIPTERIEEQLNAGCRPASFKQEKDTGGVSDDLARTAPPIAVADGS
jgi:nitric oxide reductase large subunit